MAKKTERTKRSSQAMGKPAGRKLKDLDVRKGAADVKGGLGKATDIVIVKTVDKGSTT